MKINRVFDLICSFPPRPDWPFTPQLAEQVEAGYSLDWTIPVIVTQCMEMPSKKAIPASAALICAQAAIVIVDDMLDQDPKGIYNQLGPGKAANQAASLQARAFQCIESSNISHVHKLAAYRCLNQMISITAHGQDLDTNGVETESDYWEIVRLKSAPFYATAMQLGSLMAETSEELTQGFSRIGRLVGEVVQLHDDLYDALDQPAKPDWTNQSTNLLVLYGMSVDHPDRDEFIRKVNQSGESGVLTRLQQILISSGAVSYCLYQITRRHEQITRTARGLKLATRDPIDQLVEDQLKPTKAILSIAGVDSPLIA